VSEFLENEFNQLQSHDGAVDLLANKFGEIGIAAVVAVLRVMDKTIFSRPRTESEEPRCETAVFLRDDTLGGFDTLSCFTCQASQSRPPCVTGKSTACASMITTKRPQVRHY